MEALTINQLAALCADAKSKGLGNKKILISDDDEGNGYHELFFGITTNLEDMFTPNSYAPQLPYGVDNDKAIKDYVILG